MNLLPPDHTFRWISEYAETLRGPRYRSNVVSSLKMHQRVYEQHHPGRSFIESLNCTVSITYWLQARPHYSRESLRSWLNHIRGFSRWLFELERTDHHIFQYVALNDLNGEGPDLTLRWNLQRSIARYKLTVQANPGFRNELIILPAHRWNLYRNQEWPDHSEPNERSLLDWVEGQLQRYSLKSVSGQISGLSRFFDYLVSQGGADRNRLRALFPVGRRHRLLREMSGQPPRSLVRPTPDLPPWVTGFLNHLRRRGRRADRSSGFYNDLKVLATVLKRHGLTAPEQMTAPVLQDYLQINRLDGPTSISTRNLRLNTLRGLFRFLRKRGIASPCALIDLWPKESASPFRPHIYSLKEVGQILAALRKEAAAARSAVPWNSLELMVYLLYACGLRAGEAHRLRLRDVCLQNRLLLVAKTKFYKERLVPFGRGAAHRLQAYLNLRSRLFPDRTDSDGPFILNSRGNGLARSTARALYRRTVDGLGIRSRGTHPPRFHDLRHTMAVHRLYKWYSEGADVQNKLPLLSTYLGHGRYQETENYLHLSEDLVRQAGQDFHLAFERIVGKVKR